MYRQPKPQDQARILKDALKELNLGIKHQDALSVVARMMGYPGWPMMTKEFEGAEAAHQSKALATILGPADGDLYEAMVTVDQTMSALIRVRAHSKKEAKELFGEAGKAQFPHGFEVDEGNYRSQADFYLGDENAIENISKVESESDGEHWGSASWQDERFEYKIDMSREDADSSNENVWSKCEVTLTVSKGEAKVDKTLKNFECHRSRLGAFLEEAIEKGDFDEDLEKLAAKLAKKLNLN